MLFVTETWLNTEISSGLLDPKLHYHVIRKDRDSSIGGAVAVFVKRNLQVTEVKIDEIFVGLELQCFDLVADVKKNNIRFFVVYRPPNYDTAAKNYLHLLIECLKKYMVPSHTTVIIGDFNLPKICWHNYACSSDYISLTFKDFAVMSGLHQFVNFSTHEHNLLDLVLSNDSRIVSSISPRVPIGHSDHTGVDFKLNVKTTVYISSHSGETFSSNACENKDNCTYYWHKADFDGLQLRLSQTNWDTFISLNPSATQV